MDWLGTVRMRLRSLLRPSAADVELEEELRFHVAMEQARLVGLGVPAGEARRRALASFGGVDRIAEECRDVRPLPALQAVIPAVRLAGRRLRREPWFTVPAVLTIGLGTGVLAAVFTLADGILLRPLPYPEAGRIVVVRHTLAGAGIADAGQSAGTFLHYREGARVFEEMGAYFERELTITDGDMPERVQAALVDASVLRVLGVDARYGRRFTEEDRAGSSVMLSHELWLTRYGGEAGVVGAEIRVNGTPRTVVGVLPPGFEFPHASVQMLFGSQVTADDIGQGLGDFYYDAVARLRPGVTPRDAAADLERLIGTLDDRLPGAAAEAAASQLAPRVEYLQERMVGRLRPALLLLLLGGALVMLVSVANVTSLVLARVEHAKREVAVERALGAGRRAILMRFAAEYALLGGAGALLGLGLAWLAVRLRFGFDVEHLPRLNEVALGGRTLFLLLCAVLAIATVLTLLSWVRGAQADVQQALKGSLARATPSRSARLFQDWLAAAQVAVAAALLVSSLTMVQSVWRVARVDPGFASQNAWAFDLALPARDYLPYSRSAAFLDELRARLIRIPGVDAAEAVNMLPLSHSASWFDLPVAAGDAQPDATAGTVAGIRLVTPGYFQALSIPLLAGRTFRHDDLTAEGSGVVLSRGLARRLFGDVDPLGRTVQLPGSSTLARFTVIGVAGDVSGVSLTDPPADLLYLPIVGSATLDGGRPPIPFYPTESTVVVRSSLPMATLLPAVRSALRDLDARLPVAYPRTLDDVVASGSARVRLTSWLLAAAAASTMLLGTLGLYSVVSHGASRRAPELALRLALGASPSQLRRMILRQGFNIALAGTAAGLPLAMIATSVLAGMVYGAPAWGGAAIGLVMAGVFLAAYLASVAPALRAARTDPARAFVSD